MKARRNRILVERAQPETDSAPRPRPGQRARSRAVRSVTVNLAESPLGWLKAHGHVSALQFDAGEKLREDWERAQLAANVTMSWGAEPPPRSRRNAPEERHSTNAQVEAKRRFEAAVAAVGSGLSEVLWRVVCAGEGMRDVERALGWPARAGKLVLGLALDRLAEHYRMK